MPSLPSLYTGRPHSETILPICWAILCELSYKLHPSTQNLFIFFTSPSKGLKLGTQTLDIKNEQTTLPTPC